MNVAKRHALGILSYREKRAIKLEVYRKVRLQCGVGPKTPLDVVKDLRYGSTELAYSYECVPGSRYRRLRVSQSFLDEVAISVPVSFVL